jgi:uncharacterized RDD family membrane protein YckC
MSTTEPPAGSNPPPGEPTPPPPAAGTPPPPATGAVPPPTDPGTYPPPPPPPTGATAPGVPAAGVGHPGSLLDRFLARLIDGILIGIVVGILTAVLSAASDSWLLANLVTAVVSAVLYLGYFAYLESNRGQTLGKQIMKLRVEGPSGGNPTMEQAIRRNIWTAFGIAGVVPVVGALIGALAELAAVILIAVNINSDPQRQHWFDKFAGGTRVIKIG